MSGIFCCWILYKKIRKDL